MYATEQLKACMILRASSLGHGMPVGNEHSVQT